MEKYRLSNRFICILVIVVLCFPIFIPSVNALEYSNAAASYDESMWKEMLTPEQLDEDTHVLINYLLNNGYAYDLIYFNTFDNAYRVLSEHYNILQELETRNDADRLLFAKLLEMSSRNIDLNSVEGAYEQLNLSLLMLMMNQSCFFDGLTDEDLVQLQECFECTAVAGKRSYPSTFYMGETGIYYRLVNYDYTSHGVSVPLYEAQSELTSAQKTAYNENHYREHPNASRLVDPSSRYNCHAYAWYSQSSYYWVNYVDPYLTDPCITYLYDVAQVQNGDIVVYYNIYGQVTHSALVISNTANGILCVSKWGSAGRYRHFIDDVPWSYYAGYSSPYYEILYRS